MAKKITTLVLASLIASSAAAYDVNAAAAAFQSSLKKTMVVRVLGGWSGVDSRVKKRSVEKIVDAAAWDALWKRHAPGVAAPKVDFTKSMVAAVFMGEEPSVTEDPPPPAVLTVTGIEDHVDVVLGTWDGGDLIGEKRVSPYVFIVLPGEAAAVSVVWRSSVLMSRPEVRYIDVGEAR